MTPITVSSEVINSSGQTQSTESVKTSDSLDNTETENTNSQSKTASDKLTSSTKDENSPIKKSTVTVQKQDSEVTETSELQPRAPNQRHVNDIPQLDVSYGLYFDDKGNTKKRPSEITLILLQNGKEIKKEILKIPDGSLGLNYSFKEKVPQNDENGERYEYKIKVLGIPVSYEVQNEVYQQEGQSITFNDNAIYITGTVDLTVYKNFGYKALPARMSSLRAFSQIKKQAIPESVTFHLLKNGIEVEGKTVELSESNNWTGSFKGLDYYDLDGKKNIYSVKEDKVPGYYSVVDSIVEFQGARDIYVQNYPTISVTAHKIWKNAPELKPSVKFQLYQRTNANPELGIPEGEPSAIGEPVTLSNGTESYTWEELPEGFGEGDLHQKYRYTVEEIDIPEGYTSNLSDDGLTVTNTYTSETTEVTGSKTWIDNDNQDGKRPEKINVNLLANGKLVETKEVSEANSWQYAFKNLQKYENGQEIVYTVTEDQVPEYNTEIKGYDITNSYTPGRTSVSVTKAWNDNNNKNGLRPNSIQVQLLADGKKQGDVVELNAANNWTKTWNDLAQKANGKDIAYTIEEVKVPGYTTTVNDTDKGNILLTNTYTPETTEVKGTKTWNDANNQDGKRPDKITVNLLADGEQVATKDVTEADGWAYEFKDLPKFKDGQEIVYTVTENTVKDYTTKIEGYNITNTHTPTTPNKPKTPTKPETPSTPGKHLPKTGEVNTIWWTVVGALLISSLGGYLYFRKKVER
ncbi:Cna B-type domain-containing protein [Enterococcus faecalis]|nr:Cna B-type domain-containing protein [Enterococcus faecalis]